MQMKLRKVINGVICLSLLFSLFGCKRNETAYQFLRISRDGNVLNQTGVSMTGFGEDVDYDIGLSWCSGGEKILYATRTYNSDGDYENFTICQYNPETEEIHEEDILEFLICAAYPDIDFTKQQKMLKPSALCVRDDRIYILAKVDEDDSAVFVINCTTGEVFHSKPGAYSEKYISVSDDENFIYLTKTEDNVDYIIQYDISTDHSAVYMENAKGLVFSPDYELMMYLTTERNDSSGANNEYSETVVVQKVASGEVVYENESVTSCVYNFTGNSTGLIKHELLVRHLLVGFENKEKWTLIDLSSDSTHILYETNWGDASVTLLATGQ